MDFANYITGFVDGEGCFSVSFNFRAKLKTKIEVRPSFSVSQHKRNLKVLQDLQKFFDCGGIRFSRSDQNYKFEVRQITELKQKILPHFKKFPLLTSKQDDFEKFATIVQLVNETKHRNVEHLRKIIKLACSMNAAGKRKHSEAKLLSVLDKMKI